MATEDKYGQQLQTWFERHAATEGRSVHDAVKDIGCSRQRAYQWLATGAVDVIETGEMSARGAKLYRYVAGAKDRPTAGRGRRQMASASMAGAVMVATPLALVATEAAGLIGHAFEVIGMHVDATRGVVLDCRADDGRVVQMTAVATVATTEG